MRTAVAVIVVLAFAAMVSAQLTAPVRKAKDFQGGAAQCTPGNGIIALEGGQNTGCADCLAGYYQPNSGTLACTACPAGSWSPVGSKECYWCPTGTISAAAADACDECGFGTVTVSYDGTRNIGERSNNNAESRTACFPCEADYYQPKAAQKNCMPCPANTSTAKARGAGACFAVGGGHTVGEDKKKTAVNPAAFLEQPAKPAKAPKAAAAHTDVVTHAPAGKNAPIRKSTRGSKKSKPAKAAAARFAARALQA